MLKPANGSLMDIPMLEKQGNLLYYNDISYN